MPGDRAQETARRVEDTEHRVFRTLGGKVLRLRRRLPRGPEMIFAPE